MNCIIIDDESPALSILSDYVSKMPALKLLATCDTAMDAMDVLHQQSVDLIFLDIHMPGLSGIDFVKSLSIKPLVIFVTAYPQHALEGFNLDVVDYLLKPVSFERFAQAVNKALDRGIKAGNPMVIPKVSESDIPDKKNFMFVKADYKLVKVIFDELMYIEGLGGYVRIFMMPESKPVVTLQSLQKLEEMLPIGRFLRVHKSYIVAVDRIKSIQGNMLEIGDTQIPIGKSYKKQVMQHIVG